MRFLAQKPTGTTQNGPMHAAEDSEAADAGVVLQRKPAVRRRNEKLRPTRRSSATNACCEAWPPTCSITALLKTMSNVPSETAAARLLRPVGRSVPDSSPRGGNHPPCRPQ